MKLNARGLAGILTVAAIAGCTVNTTTGTSTGTKTSSPSPSASGGTGATVGAGATVGTGTNTGTGTGSTMSPAPIASGVVALAATASDFATAQMLTLAPTTNMVEVKGTANAKDSYFMLTVPGDKLDGVLKVTIAENNNNYSPSVTYYDAGKKSLESAYANGGTSTPTTGMQDVTAGKAYYVKVPAPGEATDLDIKFEFMPVKDMSERNDTFETASMVTLGTAQDLYLFAGANTNDGSDVDYFKITVPDGATKVNVMIKNNSTADKPQSFAATLYGTDKSSIDSAYSANGQADLSGSFDVSAAGTYYLKVTADNSTMASKLTVSAQ